MPNSPAQPGSPYQPLPQNKNKKGWVYSSVLEHLTSVCEVTGSIAGTTSDYDAMSDARRVASEVGES